jgi:hypothetical protein
LVVDEPITVSDVVLPPVFLVVDEPITVTDVPTANLVRFVIRATLHSPGELRVYDSQNRVTGVVNGTVKQEIPNSSYYSNNTTVVINPATDSYYYQVVGTGTGAYGLELVYSIDGQTTTFNATNIPISSGAIHRYSVSWDALSQGKPGVTVQVDLNGDGVFERTITSGKNLTGDEIEHYSQVPALSYWGIPGMIVFFGCGMVWILNRRKVKTKV